ncbi:MAG: tetratricopeptide repeat protein [Rhodopila sp.]
MVALTYESQMHLGVALYQQGKLEEATEAFRSAIGFNQNGSDAFQCLSATLHDMGHFEAALDHILRALALAETDDREAGYLVSAGFILNRLQRPHEAISYLQRALLCNPDRADARKHLAAAQLAAGDYAAAWETLPVPPRLGHRVPPQWRGEPAVGKRLLVLAEGGQGFGDGLQFSRYLPMLRARGMRVVVYAPPQLVRLLQQSFPAVQIRLLGRPIGDISIPVMFLPMAFRTTLDTIPADVPYLHADPAQVEAWRQRLAAFEGLKVGLCWAGNPRRHHAWCESTDLRRSIAPERLAGLVAQSGCHFFSVQKTPPFAPESFGLMDYMAEMADFATRPRSSPT